MGMPLVCEARLQLFNQRQPSPAWGADYQPAIRATREEAPRISRPTILTPRKLGGREMHLLSDPETYCALLALHHPQCFDVHEQHVLSTMPALHPVAALSDAKLLPLKQLPGTVAVAERLDCIAQHPKVWIESLGDAGAWVPFPYVGDLLLFLRDGAGPYTVNWTVKLEPEDFRRLGWRRLRTTGERVVEDDLRHRIEAAHFADASIPTRQLALSQIDRHLRLNLRTAFGWDARPSNVNELTRASIVACLSAIVGTQTVLFNELTRLAREHALDLGAVRSVFYSAVWRRELRVDLFRPLLVDRPLRAERVDPLDHYSHWFAR